MTPHQHPYLRRCAYVALFLISSFGHLCASQETSGPPSTSVSPTVPDNSTCSSSDAFTFSCDGGATCVPYSQVCGAKSGALCTDGADVDPNFCSEFNCSFPYNSRKPCASNHQCIDILSFCDGVINCDDGSDEAIATCSTYNCTETSRVNCPLGEPACLWGPYQLCDGQKDCPNASDENSTYCSDFKCLDGYRKCSDGLQCIYEGQMCDGSSQCTDGSDEWKTVCSSYNCTDSGRVSCPNGFPQCMYGDWSLCNGYPDCFNQSATCNNSLASYDNSGNSSSPGDPGRGSDSSGVDPTIGMPVPPNLPTSTGSLGWPDCAYVNESNPPADESIQFCQSYSCPDGNSKCSDQIQCIWSNNYCDGSVQCRDGSDEDNNLCVSYNCSDTGRVKCPTNSSLCVYPYDVCAGANYLYGSYSDGCDLNDPSYCKDYECPSGMSKCNDQLQCVGDYSFCDGFVNCNDGSDESSETCSSYDCTLSGRLKCPNSDLCVDPSLLCDGYPGSCPNGTDEDPAFCQNYTCSLGYRKCDGVKCVGNFSMCNGYKDCKDGLDEASDFCSTFNCTDSGQFFCPSGSYCLSSSCQLCNGGIPQCPDGSDQDATYCKTVDRTLYPPCFSDEVPGFTSPSDNGGPKGKPTNPPDPSLPSVTNTPGGTSQGGIQPPVTKGHHQPGVGHHKKGHHLPATGHHAGLPGGRVPGHHPLGKGHHKGNKGGHHPPGKGHHPPGKGHHKKKNSS